MSNKPFPHGRSLVSVRTQPLNPPRCPRDAPKGSVYVGHFTYDTHDIDVWKAPIIRSFRRNGVVYLNMFDAAEWADAWLTGGPVPELPPVKHE